MKKQLVQSIFFISIGIVVFIFSPQINATILLPFKNLGLALIILSLVTFLLVTLGSLVLIVIGLVKLRKYFIYKKQYGN